MKQKIIDLTPSNLEFIEAKRDWVKNHYTPESVHKYASVDGKLKLLDVIIKSGWIEKGEKNKWQSLGVTLANIFVQEMNFVWIEVHDELGKTPALQLPDTTVIIYPLTMISKRIERNEEVDIYDLYEGVKEKVNEINGDAQ